MVHGTPPSAPPVPQFKVGDAVVQKGTGKPVMIVDEIDENGDCWCSWTDKNDRPHRKKYPANALMPAPGPYMIYTDK